MFRSPLRDDDEPMKPLALLTLEFLGGGMGGGVRGGGGDRNQAETVSECHEVPAVLKALDGAV